jgi:hypothetical protein
MVAQVTSGGVAIYYSSSLPDGISDNDLDQRSPLVYPLPVTDGVVNIALGKSDGRTLEVRNTLGEVQQRISVQGVDVVHLGTDAMAPRTYVFRCFAKDDALVGQGRFIVVR